MNAHVPPPSNDIDAELIELGRKLELAWKIEKAICESVSTVDFKYSLPKCSAAYDATASIVDRIIPVPAHTIEGLRVKALALSWWHGGKQYDPADDSQETDIRLASTILRDLLAIAA